jgi:DNA-binding NarL/FixJ family response regulator
MHVLTVSKYAIVRAGLRCLLGSDLDVKVIGEAETPQQAEKAIPELRPAVVLVETVDANQPDLIQFIVAHAENTHVVLLANFGEPQVVRALLRAGLVGYVLKQSGEAELLKYDLQSETKMKGSLDLRAFSVPAPAGSKEPQQTSLGEESRETSRCGGFILHHRQ